MRSAILGSLILLALLYSGGCSPLPGKGLWGRQATLRPGWHQVKSAAVMAATDPMTWMPAAGAALFSLGNLDDRTSRWAVKHKPVFGGDASSASDTLRDSMTAAYVVTALAAPGGDTTHEAVRNKARGFAVGLTAVGTNNLLTLGLKELASRERPDRSDDDSFPSGHASQTAAFATLAAQNLDFIDMPAWGRTGLKATFLAVTVGTGWARVESEEHYPSDVLAGFALGHFISAFVNEAFLTPPATEASSIWLEPAPRGVGLTVSFAF